MANLPTIKLVRHKEQTVVCVCTFADMHSDGFKGVNYVNYDVANGRVVGYGLSKGFQGTGAGSMPLALNNATKAANRYLKRKYGATK